MSGDNNIEAQGKQKAESQTPQPNKLLDDTSFNKYVRADGTAAPAALTSQADSGQLSGLTSSAFGRSAYALGEGLTQIPHGMFKAAQYDFEHPWKIAETAAIGAAFGIGMRTLLPEAGAAKALVGTAMSYFFIRDAAKPVMETVRDASMAQNMGEVHQAASNMGDALGNFGVDSIIAMGAGGLGEKAAGGVLKGTVTGRQFEAWKNLTLNSDETAIGRFFTGSAKMADSASEAVASSSENLAGRMRGSGRGLDNLSIDEKLRLINETNKRPDMEGVDNPSSKAAWAQMDKELAAMEDRIRQVGDGMKQGVVDLTPRDNTLQGFNLDQELAMRKSYLSKQFSAKIDDLVGEHPAESAAAGTTAAGDVGTTPGAKQPLRAVDGHNTPDQLLSGNEGGDGKIIITDAAAKTTDAGGPKGPKPEMNGENVGQMATAVRGVASSVTKENIAVAQVKEDFTGPLVSTMRDGGPIIDAGHFNNNEMLINLIKQIRNAQDVRQAGMLLDHFRTANQQLELAHTGANGGLMAITDLNQYARSIHTRLLGALDTLGIPRDVVRGSNSPLFSIRDSDGAGPYTIPAIKGVSDAAVVTYPREYQGLEGVHTSGVYAHELGHDLIYGDLLRFPAELRDKILTENVIGKAMKDAGIADTEIDVPGHGTMKTSEFLAQVLKAQANENTADMFGSSIDPNTGLSLATLLGSLRKPATTAPGGPGLLETRSVYGKDMVDEGMGNDLGIEAHGIDKWRIKLAAQMAREGANGHQGLLTHADHLDALAESMARPGTQYVWANADEPGKFVAIPQKTVDALIPHLVKAQMDTPLDALNGHTLREVMPKMSDVYDHVDKLSTQMADGALKGKDTIAGFEKSDYRIEDVFSAGLSGWMKAVAKNNESGGTVTPTELMNRMNKISDSLRALYRNDTPESTLAANPGKPVKLSDIATVPLGFVADAAARMARAQTNTRNFFADWTPRIGAYAGASELTTPLDALRRDLMNQQQVQGQFDQQHK